MDQPLRMDRAYTPYHDPNFFNQYFYYQRDRLGNITEITNSVGTVVQRYVYDAFGKITIYDDQNNIITPDSPKYLKNPFTYTGREYDPETGLYYFRARYYNPETGRFLSEDPIGFGGRDANLYRYVLNNPTNLTDPSGEVIPILLVIILKAGAGSFLSYEAGFFIGATINKHFSDIDYGETYRGGGSICKRAVSSFSKRFFPPAPVLLDPNTLRTTHDILERKKKQEEYAKEIDKYK